MKRIVFVGSLLFLVVFISWAGFLVYKEWRIKASRRANSNPPEGITNNVDTKCKKTDECAIAIQTKKRCACPQAVNKSMIGVGDWAIYEKGKDYSLPEDKEKGISCAPCLASDNLYCIESNCHLLQ